MGTQSPLDVADDQRGFEPHDAIAGGGRLKFIALILEEDPARAILESLHLPSEPPPIARARSPDWLEPIPLDAKRWPSERPPRFGAAESELSASRRSPCARSLSGPVWITQHGNRRGRMCQRKGSVRSTRPCFGCLSPYVIANFQETQIGTMRPGQAVTVSVDAFAPRRFEGKVDTIAGGTQGRFSLLPSDNAAENFVKVVQRVPVKVRLAATDAVLLPGLSAGVTVNVR
jgi:Cation efflux system protein CusB domain 1